MEFELGNEALKNLIKAEGAFRQIATRKQQENKLNGSAHVVSLSS